MPALREVLTEAGFSGVRTYVQSGNVVLTSPLASDELAHECSGLIEQRFGFPVPALARTREELAAVVARNPLAEVAVDPRRYQVTFLAAALEPSAVERVNSLSVAPERIAVVDRELYSWHPEGVARSQLWARLSSERFLGVTGTARNWTTVTTLLSMADEL